MPLPIGLSWVTKFKTNIYKNQINNFLSQSCNNQMKFFISWFICIFYLHNLKRNYLNDFFSVWNHSHTRLNNFNLVWQTFSWLIFRTSHIFQTVGEMKPPCLQSILGSFFTRSVKLDPCVYSPFFDHFSLVLWNETTVSTVHSLLIFHSFCETRTMCPFLQGEWPLQVALSF